jgi:Protein of unknown function (DUF2510)
MLQEHPVRPETCQGEPMDNLPVPSNGGPSAGWFADPHNPSGAQRYWDGTQWTGHVQGSPQQALVPSPSMYVVAAPIMGQGNGMATAGGTLGIISIVLVWIPLFIGLFFGWTLGILGIIFGSIGIAKAKRVGNGQGMGVTGLVLGIVTLLLTFVGVGTLF